MEAQGALLGLAVAREVRDRWIQHEDDAVTLDELFETRYAPLCRVAAAMLSDRDAAEQVVMDAFEEVVKRWRSIDDPAAYLRRSVVNKANTLLRRRTNERKAHTLLFGRSAPTAVSTADEWVARQPILAAVQQLPPRQRAVVVLYYLEDLPVDDIAATLGCSAGAVKNRLSVARGTLRRFLEVPS